MEDEKLMVPSEFADICPIEDKDFHNEMSMLVNEPMFEHVASVVMPEYNYSQLKIMLLSLNSKEELQSKVMVPFVDRMLKTTSEGVTSSGIENLVEGVPNTFITNHRDIVLDSALLGYLMAQNNMDTCEIAIGDNLLIYNWIAKLVRLNKCFIVKRNLGRMQTMTAALQLSSYIHFVLTQKKGSIWIAQREGRCKDSNDRTQESLMKMLTYGNRKVSFVDSLKELNIAPIALSYEYDPNDRLKAREYLLKSKNPNFKKTQDDDLISMKTGIAEYKGHIHFSFAPCINDQLERIPADLDRILMVQRICAIIDHAIHSNYKIFKTNYMAHDMLMDNKDFAEYYTAEDAKAFNDYLMAQLDKITDIPVSDGDRNYMFRYMLLMYSNPLTNQIAALGKEAVMKPYDHTQIGSTAT